MNTATATATEHELNGRTHDACHQAFSPERTLARNLMKMTRNADLSTPSVSIEELTVFLEAQNQAAANGDLSHVRRILSNQVTMLERLTDHLFSRAMGMGPVVDVYERYLKMAFRAQAQCLRTATLLKKMTDSSEGRKAPRSENQTATMEEGVNQRRQADALVERGLDRSASGFLETAGKDAHPTLGQGALSTTEG